MRKTELMSPSQSDLLKDILYYIEDLMERHRIYTYRIWYPDINDVVCCHEFSISKLQEIINWSREAKKYDKGYSQLFNQLRMLFLSKGTEKEKDIDIIRNTDGTKICLLKW